MLPGKGHLNNADRISRIHLHHARKERPIYHPETVTPTSTSEWRIERSGGWVSLKLHELWEYRELLYFLT